MPDWPPFLRKRPVIALLGLGIVVTIFGAVVLLVFPDRPGGKIEVRALGGVNSAGAGLPIIALGIVAVAYAASHGGAGDLGGGVGPKPSSVPTFSAAPSPTQTSPVASPLPSISLSPTATAVDMYPCGAQFTPHDDPAGHQAQRCLLVPGGAPVYDSPDKGNGAVQVGMLPADGGNLDTANWFVGQSERSSYTWETYTNRWWAFTLSEKDASNRSHWGWVPETFFKGGADNEPDAGLFDCETHGNSCRP